MKTRQLTIDPEFRDKIPPLSQDEFSKLEENILADGEVREPLVLWGNTIIDGHHRWAIIQNHPEIPYKVKQIDFPDKWAAIAWMCRNQLGRRNLTNEQRSYLRGKQYEAEKMSQGGDRRSDGFSSGQNDRLNRREIKDGTAGRVGKEYGVDGRTIRRDADYSKSIDEAEIISPGIKESILSGEVKAPKSMIAEIRNVPEEKRSDMVDAIKHGDTGTAKAIIQESKQSIEKKPEPEPEAFTPEELGELIDAAASNLDFALKQHLVLVHRDVLDVEKGREAAKKSLNGVIAVAEKYMNMIRRIEENGTTN